MERAQGFRDSRTPEPTRLFGDQARGRLGGVVVGRGGVSVVSQDGFWVSLGPGSVFLLPYIVLLCVLKCAS